MKHLVVIATMLLASVAALVAAENSAPAGETAAPKPAVSTTNVVPGQWTMDFDAARAVAKEKKLPLLLNFTGSDWCPYCKIVDKDVFQKPEWQDYARGKLLLVTLDFPRNQELVPKEFRERNAALQEKYGISGFPTFLILAPDGETVVRKFGIQSGQTPYTFMKEVGTSLRRMPGEVEKLLAGLPDDRIRQYKKQVEDLDAAQKQLDDWIATGPQGSEENQRTFEEHQRKIADLSRGVEALETEKVLARFAGDQAAADTAMLRKAQDLARSLGELQEAQANLESWLLARPEKSAKGTEVFQKLRNRLNEAVQKIKAASTP